MRIIFSIFFFYYVCPLILMIYSLIFGDIHKLTNSFVIPLVFMTSLTLCNISRLVATMFISKSCEDNDDFGQIHDKMCQKFYK